MPQLLLELFSEEIPARMQANAARDLERMARERLTAAGFAPAIRSFAGPRRLTLVVDDLPAAQEDRSEEVKGPRVGAPPQAMEGFLKKVGLTQSDLAERDGVYYATLSSKGRPTAQIIAEMVDGIVRGFPWPKSMKWGTGTLRWVRPLKRILCVFDGAVVPFDVDGIESSDLTEGHRFMGAGRGQPFAVKDFKSYEDALDAHFVVIEADERKRRILDGARKLCAAKGLELVEDEGLLEEVAGLAEWPVPILGDMDPSFLDLPPEVIRTSMRTHQKYFAVRDPHTGKLAPHFLVVSNIEAIDGGKAVAAGNARVLSARLNDARFFWDEDRKVGFEPWLEKLDGVTFHAKLGTMKERVERIVALAREIAPLVGADPDIAAEAALLAKADLASGMVGEFPELQGIMGGYYARAGVATTGPRTFGEEADAQVSTSDLIADAIRDHYKPQGPGDTVPTAPVSVAVALADKLDTLVGFFVIGEKPTGSKDPYALRRSALGVIRIIQSNNIVIPLKWIFQRQTIRAIISNIRVDFDRIVSTSADELSKMADDAVAKARGLREKYTKAIEDFETALNDGRYLWPTFEDEHGLLAFLADRLKVLLRDQGKRHDLVDAVFALGDDDLVRIVARVDALDAFLTTDDGANLLAGYKRATNILRAEEKKGAVPTGMVQTGLAGQPDEEVALAFAVSVAQTAVEPLLEAEDFAGAMAALAKLRGPVDAFFDKVLVNSDVPAERDNRLKLLGQVRDLMGKVADFSLIGG